MDFEFVIPLTFEDLVNQHGYNQYAVREVATFRELSGNLQEAKRAQKNEGFSFILEHFDTLYSAVVHAKELQFQQLIAVLNLSIANLDQMSESLSTVLDDEIQTELRKKMLNISKMSLYVFSQIMRVLEDKKLQKNVLSTKGSRKGSKSDDENDWAEDRMKALFSLYNLFLLPLQKLWDPPVAEEEFINLAANICYKALEDPGISAAKMKPTRDTLFQILGILVSRFQHGLSCTVKVVQLIRIYEHLCTALAEGVVVFVEDYGCKGFIREVVREICESESAYDQSGAKVFSMFLTEIAKNASGLILPIMSLLLPHLDNDPYTMRNCVLDIMGEIVVQNFSSEILQESDKETRNMFLDHLQDHLYDVNAYVRSKALKVWQRLAQEKLIPLSRFGSVVSNVLERVGDNSWTVVRYAVQLLKIVLENNPFGGKIDANAITEQLKAEEKKLEELEKEKNDLTRMTRPQRWQVLESEIMLAVEQALHTEEITVQSNESVSEEAMFENICSLIDGKNFTEAFQLLRLVEKMLPGACEARKGNNLEWQVDYFLRLMKKIYTTIASSENKENEGNKAKKNRKLVDLHPDENAQPVESKEARAAAEQEKVVQFLKESLQFADEMKKASTTICSLLSCNQIPVVQESIEFFTMAHIFGFEEAEAGVKEMLMLMWSSESVVKEAVAVAYRKLYLDVESNVPGGRARADQIVRNLSKLLKSLGVNEQAALEILVKEWVSSDAIDKACIQVMWERFTRTLTDTTPEESHAALCLITMVASAKLQVVQTNIDVLMKVGLGVKENRDLILVRETCRAFLKLAPEKKGVTTNEPPLKFESDHILFSNLKEILIEKFCCIEECGYQQMAGSAIDVIYQLSEKPDSTCGSILQEVISLIKLNYPSAELDSTVIDRASSQAFQAKEFSFPAELLSRLIFLIGHVGFRQWMHLDKSIFRELKRRNRVREETKAKKAQQVEAELAMSTTSVTKSRKKSNKKNQADNSATNHSVLSASHTMLEKQDNENDELGGDIAADDAEAEYVNNIFENELLSPDNLLGSCSSLVISVCSNPQKYPSVQLRSTASLALTKLMLISSQFCESNLQLVFTMMEKSPEHIIRSNLIYAMGDLANRFPNLIEPWTRHLYSRLQDESASVRLDTIIVLKHLIMNEMVKVRGQISDLALCIVDEDDRISTMATSLFEDLSKKGNTLYNVMPDIISRLSSPSLEVDEEKFHNIMKFLIDLIQKDRQMESLVDKLCQRFRASTCERQWTDLAFCLSLLQYSDRSLRRLLENLPCYAEKLTVPDIYNTFCGILTAAGRTQKPERASLVDELKAKIEECLRVGLPNGDQEGNSAEDDERPDVPKTPARRRRGVPATPRTVQRSTRKKGRSARRRKSSSSDEQPSDDSDDVFESEVHRKRVQRNRK